MNTRHHHRAVPFVLLLLALSLGSCDRGGSSGVTTPDQARNRIEASLDGFVKSQRTLEQGAFSTAVKNFLGLEDGVATSGDWAARLGSELNTVIDVSDEGRVRFEESTGIYAWKDDSRAWGQVESADAIVLQFPASDSATRNNATLTISSYADAERSIGGESVYVPKRGAASLTVDGTEVFAASLSDVSYASVGGFDLPIPTSLSLDVFTAPQTHRLRLKEVESGTYSLSAETRNGDQLVSGLSATVDAGLSVDGISVRTLSGEARIGTGLAVPYTIDVDDLLALDDPSEQQINDQIDARVKYKGEKIATLRYDSKNEEVRVVYPDGTEDPAAVFYEGVLEELRAIWADYLGSEPVEAIRTAATDLFSSE